MSESMDSISQTVRGVVTVAVRRGPSYFGYLAHGVMWPRASYELSWGPRAPAIAKGVFAAVAEWSGEPVPREIAEAAGLVALPGAQPAASVGVDEIEALMDAAHRLGITGLDRAFKTLVRTTDDSLRFGDLSGARRYPTAQRPFSRVPRSRPDRVQYPIRRQSDDRNEGAPGNFYTQGSRSGRVSRLRADRLRRRLDRRSDRLHRQRHGPLGLLQCQRGCATRPRQAGHRSRVEQRLVAADDGPCRRGDSAGRSRARRRSPTSRD